MRFHEDLKIQKYFGDFGGDYSERDTVAPEKKVRAAYLERLLPSKEFEDEFNTCLKVVLPGDVSISTYTAKDGRKVYTAPAYARYYLLAGYLALNALDGRQKMVMGTFSGDMALTFAQACKVLGFGCRICLGKDLIEDSALQAKLKALGAELDVETCVQMFDTPYAYVNFDDAAGFGIVPAEANYGIYPQAAISGLFAGLYSADLKTALNGNLPGSMAIAITTGTDAVGALPCFMNEKMCLATVEETVAKEYHLEDSGCYTLSTRSGDADRPNTTICPELAYWWHRAKICRLGCDRIFPVDISAFDGLALSEKTKRTAALAFEAFETADVLVVEEN